MSQGLGPKGTLSWKCLELSPLPLASHRADSGPTSVPTPIPSHHLCLCYRLSGSKITARGIGHLVPALRLCPQLEEVR